MVTSKKTTNSMIKTEEKYHMSYLNRNGALTLDELFLVGDYILIDNLSTAWIREKKRLGILHY